MITLRQEESTLYITITGQLLISNIYELTSALTRFSDTCDKYRVDLQDVDLVSDGGLVVLLMFTSHARRHGQNVLLMDCSIAVIQRIAQFPSLLALCQAPLNCEPVNPNHPSFKHSSSHTRERDDHIMRYIHLA